MPTKKNLSLLRWKKGFITLNGCHEYIVTFNSRIMLFLFIQAESLISLQSEKLSELAGYYAVSQYPKHYRKPIKVENIDKEITCVLYTEIDFYNSFICIDLALFVPGAGFTEISADMKNYFCAQYGIYLTKQIKILNADVTRDSGRSEITFMELMKWLSRYFNFRKKSLK